MKPDIALFIVITAVIGTALGLSDAVFSNYFKEVYDVTAAQRGFIEFPRELPGLLCLLIIGMGSFLGDIRLAIVAQLMGAIGVMVLGLITPPFAVMLVFLFINSLGMHMHMPLADSIGLSLVKDPSMMGKRMGQFRSTSTAFGLIAGLIVFFGFRTGFFRFDTPVKYVFVTSAILFFVAFILYLRMNRIADHPPIKKRSFKFVFRKEYKYYYILATMHGAQKQIMIVFGPWVLIEILGKGADTMAVLSIIGAFLGIFFLRALGKWIDRFGIRNLLLADAISFIVVYILYGILSAGFHHGRLALTGLPVIIAFSLFILDRMSMQMGMIRIVYLKHIAQDHSDITPTLSTGITLDHVVSIVCAYLGGMAWMAWGPQYVFYIAAGLSMVNLVVSRLVHIPTNNSTALN